MNIKCFRSASSIPNRSKLFSSINEDIGDLRIKYTEIQKKRITCQILEKELTNKLKKLLNTSNHTKYTEHSRNKSKESIIKVKTILVQNRERITKLKKTRSIEEIKLHQTIQEKKLRRNQSTKLIREQTLKTKSEEASRSKQSRLSIEQKIQVCKTNYLKKNQSMRDIVKNSYMKIEDKNNQVINKKQDIIKKVLMSRIKEEEELKRYYESKVKEFQRKISHKIEKFEEKKKNKER